MPAVAFHGTPITSVDNIVLETMGARDYCVSFYRPDQVEWIDTNSRTWFGDNGIYSAWRASIASGNEANFGPEYWNAYYAWCRRWCLEGRRCSWVVIPDPIGVGTQLLDAMIREWPEDLKAFGVPVWHSDEPISRALMLLDRFGRLCVGAVGEHQEIGCPTFCLRMDELWDAILKHFGRVMPVHIFRSLSLLKPQWPWPWVSHDSTAIARNIWRVKKFGPARQQKIIRVADRWDALAANRPIRWVKPERLWQPGLFGEAA